MITAYPALADAPDVPIDPEGKSYEAECDGFMSAACQSLAGQKPVIGP
jgi:hypothetical protein